jgi:hypothetical protein
MKNLITIFLCTLLGLMPISKAYGQFFDLCEDIGVTLTASDSNLVQLYHAGFFIFGATPNVGAYETVCEWTVVTLDGEMVLDTTSTGDWAEQSFMTFSPNLELPATLLVDLVLTNPNVDFPCCISDTLAWVEGEGPFGPTTDWEILSGSMGVPCETSLVEFAQLNQPRLFPMPVTDRIKLSKPTGIAHLAVYDLTGRPVDILQVNSTRYEWDVSHLGHGGYVVQMIDFQGDVIHIQRLLKLGGEQ